ncbi:MAG: Imm1 family immunity protein [Pseudonocardiaceae bacterium]
MATVLRDDQGNLIDLTALPVDADVAGALRATNDEHGAELPRLWRLTVEHDVDQHWGGSGPAVWLDAGTAGVTGALRWIDRSGEYVPAVNARRLFSGPQRLSYFDWAGTACSVHIALQVPIELVLAAVAEVSTTRLRPTCVQWIPIEGSHVLVGPPVER